MTRNFSELSSAVRNCKDEKLVRVLRADAKRYNIDLERLDIYGGKIAGHKPFDSDGGGIEFDKGRIRRRDKQKRTGRPCIQSGG